MNILVIASNNYPSTTEPQKGTFVYKLVQEFAKQNQVYVFAPEKRFLSQNKKSLSYGAENALVFRPTFTTLSNKNVMGFNTYHIGRRGLVKRLREVYRSIEKVDFVYAHFLSNALIAVEALQDYKVPVFAAVGEYKNIDVIKAYYNDNAYFKLIYQIRGFIAVSPQVQEKLLGLKIANQDNFMMAPNGVNRNLFKPVDSKKELRRELNLPIDKKIILFVGRFQHDKGSNRVLEALEILDNPAFVLVLLGVGSQQLESKYIHFKGAVKNEYVAKYMAASDVFVLPTLHEGSSNVIVEAMASGLPIISSDIPEVKVQCTKDFSLLVDPMNIDSIAESIDLILSNSTIRNKMSLAARNHSEIFDLKNRADNILNFIKSRL